MIESALETGTPLKPSSGSCAAAGLTAPGPVGPSSAAPAATSPPERSRRRVSRRSSMVAKGAFGEAFAGVSSSRSNPMTCSFSAPPDVGEALIVGDRIAGEKRNGLASVPVRIQWEERRAQLRGQDAARLDDHRRRARDVPERALVIVHEGERAGGDVAEGQAVEPTRRSRYRPSQRSTKGGTPPR